MKAILLLAVVLNFHGAGKMLAAAIRQVPPAVARGEAKDLHFQWFAAGTAAVFGSLYLYLYFYPAFVVPFLIFGAALKTWVLAFASYLYLKHCLSRRIFLEFGAKNGVMAALFWLYIAASL